MFWGQVKMASCAWCWACQVLQGASSLVLQVQGSLRVQGAALSCLAQILAVVLGTKWKLHLTFTALAVFRRSLKTVRIDKKELWKLWNFV